MLHRLIGLSSVLLVGLAGCSLCSHQGSGCCQHGQQQGNSWSLNAACGVGPSGTCAAPLYPGDQNAHGNCQKHSQQPPMQRLATAFRRKSSQWMSGQHAGGCPCGSCGFESYQSQPMMWEQAGCGESMCGMEQGYGCDSCAPLLTSGWSPGGSSVSGGFYETADHGPTGCSCGEQHSTNESMYIQEGHGPYEHATEAPMMNVPENVQSNAVPRSFPPIHPHVAPATPDPLNDNVAKPLPIPPAAKGPEPMPQDLTPMDPPMEFPKNTPDAFDPLHEEGAPAAEKVLDPVSFEIPRLPAIPERTQSSVKRGTSNQVQRIATDAEQFQR